MAEDGEVIPKILKQKKKRFPEKYLLGQEPI